MKRAKAKTDRKSGAHGPARKSLGKPLDLALVRERITNLVGHEAQSMGETTIAEVSKGHYLAMKYLFEMIGLYPGAAQEEVTGEDDSLAKTLLRRLGLPEEPTLETPVAKNSDPNQPAATEDTVK